MPEHRTRPPSPQAGHASRKPGPYGSASVLEGGPRHFGSIVVSPELLFTLSTPGSAVATRVTAASLSVAFRRVRRPAQQASLQKAFVSACFPPNLSGSGSVLTTAQQVSPQAS